MHGQYFRCGDHCHYASAGNQSADHESATNGNSFGIEAADRRSRVTATWHTPDEAARPVAAKDCAQRIRKQTLAACFRVEFVGIQKKLGYLPPIINAVVARDSKIMRSCI